MNDWTAFGRVDADGTVYVKTAEGDRVVGSWQAGTPEEGLAHFARRFADLVTEVDLIEARLKSGAADASHSLTSVKRIRDTLGEAHVVGDLDGLATRLDRLAGVAEEKAGEARAAREVARGEALARKTALVEEAEKIAAEFVRQRDAQRRLSGGRRSDHGHDARKGVRGHVFTVSGGQRHDLGHRMVTVIGGRFPLTGLDL